MNNRHLNLLLAAIAAGLWANALLPLFRPMPVAAQSGASIEHLMGNIEHNVNDIAHGFCTNSKICGR